MNRETGNVVISIVDKETKEVVKTIPPGEIDNVSSKLSTGNFLIDNIR